MSTRSDLELIKRVVEIVAREVLAREYAKDMRHERELRAGPREWWVGRVR
jgi:hypothetical protein